MKARFEKAGIGPVDLIASGGGVFEVVQYRQSDQPPLIYSKQSTGRFPTEAELDGLIEALGRSAAGR